MDANYSHKNGTAALERSLMYQVMKDRLYFVVASGHGLDSLLRRGTLADLMQCEPLMAVNEKLPLRHSQDFD